MVTREKIIERFGFVHFRCVPVVHAVADFMTGNKILVMLRVRRYPDIGVGHHIAVNDAADIDKIAHGGFSVLLAIAAEHDADPQRVILVLAED